MDKIEIKKLKQWFLEEKRDLPWRDNPTPYQVWVSEVMLQQTQVAVVIPYFLRWMARFPTIRDLAQASLKEVIKLWEGLGYYSRARNLYEGAKHVLNVFKGVIPDNAQELAKIKGLGPYTVGAILSFAFHQKTAAVDGNVLRVLARYFNIREDVSKPKTVQNIRQVAHNLLPDDESWIVNEALIELGATYCGKKAHCHKCPLQGGCKALALGVVDQLPFKPKRKKTTFLHRLVVIGMYEDQILLRKGQPNEIMHDLYEFPYIEIKNEVENVFEAEQTIQKNFGVSLSISKQYKMEKHSFTSFCARLYPFQVHCAQKLQFDRYFWESIHLLSTLPFSSGHKRVLTQLLSHLSK